jgi:KEOPS complex subunit Pcc1
MNYTATFRFSGDSAPVIYQSVCQEAGDVGGRSVASVFLDDHCTLVLSISAADAPALRAALNSWLRLINVAYEIHTLASGARCS